MFIRNKTPGLENNQEGTVYVGVQSINLQILQDSKYCLVVEEHLQNERSCYYFRYSSYIQPSLKRWVLRLENFLKLWI